MGAVAIGGEGTTVVGFVSNTRMVEVFGGGCGGKAGSSSASSLKEEREVGIIFYEK